MLTHIPHPVRRGKHYYFKIMPNLPLFQTILA